MVQTIPKHLSYPSNQRTLSYQMKRNAMDKIVGYCAEPIAKHDALKSIDAMDCIVFAQSENVKEQPNVLNVETVTRDAQINSVSAKHDDELNVETSKLKACHVCVRPLENILFEKTKTDLPVPMNELACGTHDTRSCIQKPVVRTSRIPRKASTGKQYEEQSDTLFPQEKEADPCQTQCKWSIRYLHICTKNQISVSN